LYRGLLHLNGLELGMSVAKRTLEVGEILGGEGGFTVAGQLRPSAVSVPMRALPLGLTGGAGMVRADQALTWDDVVLDEGLAVVTLRHEV
jgi:predicted homoserine dehydrogenase-like protein